MSTEEIKALQRELGVTADGIWGPNTEAAYQAVYGGGGNDPTFKSVTQDALSEKAAGGDPNKTITEAMQAGIISKDQYKSLKYTFDF
jgi:peptidoglycan hydrolase-like protein with peptidoglycan-binding domain